MFSENKCASSSSFFKIPYHNQKYKTSDTPPHILGKQILIFQVLLVELKLMLNIEYELDKSEWKDFTKNFLKRILMKNKFFEDSLQTL